MRESQIKEIKAFYSAKLKNKLSAKGNDCGNSSLDSVSKPFFNSVMDKLNAPQQK